MAYHILEVRSVDAKGNIQSPREFFIVNELGDVVRGPFASLEEAIEALRELEEEDAPPPPGSSGQRVGM